MLRKFFWQGVRTGILAFVQGLQEAEGVLESPQKKRKEDESFIKPPVKRALFSDDADYNTVYGSQPKTSPGITKFSKDKKIQRIQVQSLRKHFKEKLQVVRDDV